jgi:hypothetical protein
VMLYATTSWETVAKNHKALSEYICTDEEMYSYWTSCPTKMDAVKFLCSLSEESRPPQSSSIPRSAVQRLIPVTTTATRKDVPIGLREPSSMGISYAPEPIADEKEEPDDTELLNIGKEIGNMNFS